MSLKCNDLINHIEEYCPRELALEWDNVGLIVGDRNQEVKKVLVALDAIEEVIDEGIEKNIDMIVTHHPLFIPKYSTNLKSITTDFHLGKLIHKLIKNNISLYCAHTNLDIAKDGVNDTLANLLELQGIKPLEVTGFNKLKKIVVFVPESHIENVRDAMNKAGAGWIGNYSDCSFVSEGVGTFKPLDGSNPFIGSTDELEKVKEYRLETVVKQKDQNKVINAMLKAHPYEEVAYDVYTLENKGKSYGVGRVGELSKEIGLSEFINQIKEKLDIQNVRFIGNIGAKVKKIALCSGSGMSMLNSVKQSGAKVFVTGDVKYHEVQEAQALGINIIDAGHYGTEKIIVPIMKKYLEKLENIEVIETEIDGEPFLFV